MVKGGWEMSFRSRLKIEHVGMFMALVFYAIAGIICLVVLPLTGFPPHIGIIGIMSLLIAYGLFGKRAWTIWFVAMVFFIATTFSVATLYFGRDVLLDISMVAYLILTWIFTAYVVDKRKTLES
jgi:predicted cobalt transporter CbtA